VSAKTIKPGELAYDVGTNEVAKTTCRVKSRRTAALDPHFAHCAGDCGASLASSEVEAASAHASAHVPRLERLARNLSEGARCTEVDLLDERRLHPITSHRLLEQSSTSLIEAVTSVLYTIRLTLYWRYTPPWSSDGILKLRPWQHVGGTLRHESDDIIIENTLAHSLDHVAPAFVHSCRHRSLQGRFHPVHIHGTGMRGPCSSASFCVPADADAVGFPGTDTCH